MCCRFEVWYKSSNAIHKIKLEIIDDSYTWDDMIKVKFTGSNDSYELLFTYYGVELECHNPDGSVQIFESIWED